mmetsp:Transcript_11167/g.18956  ORF Transcript_11167/g.18956 Transcript_11167/m.18956 type:complete len:344 (-) Transcript_11167:133-1164(-)
MATAFSFSAPRFTEEQKEKEDAALGEQEKAQIENDLYGKAADDVMHPEETEFFLSGKLDEFQQELDAIEYKPAYDEAMEKVPELVKKESPAINLLRCEHYDAKLAAARMVAYWKFRKQFFGEDNAFLPMEARGAMKDDIEFLKEGTAFQLAGTDSRGRPIVVYESFRTKVSHLQNKGQTYRALFFAMHKIAMSSKTAQLDGMVIVCNCKNYDIRTFDRKWAKVNMAFIVDGAPCKISADHIIAADGPTLQNIFISIIMPMLMVFLGKHLRQRILFHTGQDSENVKVLNESYGIPSLCIPTGLGGDWTLYNYEEWLNHELTRPLPDYNNNNNTHQSSSSSSMEE